jgi:ABC-type multidrug transport system fused ATPase/permease subunit
VWQPTSALDQQSEAAVQEAIDRMLSSSAGGKTSITVAHRLNTIRNCDSIFVMSNGQIVEQGCHKDLMLDRSGLYRKFVYDQTKPGQLGDELSTAKEEIGATKYLSSLAEDEEC